jgi:hypothetical protein
MPRRAALSALALTATVSILAGCGSGSSSGNTGSTGGSTNNSTGAPATELTDAITALGNASTIDAVLKINGSGSDLQSFVKQQDPSTKLTSTQAAEIAGVQVEIEAAAPSGKTLSDINGSTAGTSNITITDQGTALFTLRVVNKTLYFQIDAKDLLDKLGQSASYAQIQAAGPQLPAFAQALFQGKWVSLPQSTAKSLSNQLGVSSSSSGNQTAASALLGKLKTLLTKDVTVTRSTSGSTDVLTLSGNTRTLASDFASTFASSIPGAGAALGSANLSKVPSKTLSLKASVTGGALSGLTIDVGQFAKSGGGSLPIALTIAQSGPAITAPSGAVPVDLSQLTQLLGSFGGGL